MGYLLSAAGVLLLGRKRNAALAAGFISYLHGSLLFLALLLIMILQPVFWGTPLIATDSAVICGMSLLLIIPCALLLSKFTRTAKSRV